MTELERAWLAGIVEGEGYIDKNGGDRHYARLRIKMCDEDIIARVASLFMRSYSEAKDSSRKPHHRDQYVVTITGEPAKEILRSIRPLLGERRRAAVDAALA